MKTCYVTAIYDVYNNPQRVAEYIELFKPFADDPDLSFCIFTDQPDLQFERKKGIDIVRYDIDIQQSDKDYIIPLIRNEPKDTQAYLLLMNMKPLFIHKAQQRYPTATAFVWLDFGVLKVSKNVAQFIEHVKRFDKVAENYPNKIIIPGWNSTKQTTNLIEKVYWRFFGGVVIVPSTLVEIFYNLATEYNRRLEPRLTWEVNVWASIESDHPDLFLWYGAMFDNSMVINIFND